MPPWGGTPGVGAPVTGAGGAVGGVCVCAKDATGESAKIVAARNKERSFMSESPVEVGRSACDGPGTNHDAHIFILAEDEKQNT